MADVTESEEPKPRISGEQFYQPITPSMGPVIMIPLFRPEKDYLLLSIISFFFFILLAIPALLFSLKTREANFLGDQKRAQRNSRLALFFGISSILLGCLTTVFSVAVGLLKHKI